MTDTIRQRLELAQEHFRRGNYVQAEYMLVHLERSRIPRDVRIECARLARLAGFPSRALRILGRAASGDAALSEYAACLAILGGRSESEKVFARVDPDRYPEALLLRATGLMASWAHAQAVPLLEAYLARTGDETRILEARLRLLACGLRSADAAATEKSSRALSELLDRGIPEAQRAWLVYARHLKIEARYSADGDVKGALREAEELIRRFPEHDMSVPRVWRALLSTRVSGDAEGLHRLALQAERQALGHAGHWHLVRIADFYEVFVLRDASLFRKVHFGTPFPELRRLLRFRFADAPRPPASHDWAPGPFRRGAPVVDLGSSELRAASRPIRLLRALCADFYRPIPEAELNEAVFPSERFDPSGASLRVRVAAHRLREWLKDRKLPLRIEAADGAYRWSADSAAILRVPDPDLGAPVLDSSVDRLGLPALAARFGAARFRATDAAAAWDVPKRTAQHRLARLARSGEIEVKGKGPTTSYAVVRR
jgi:tetratricopeptide (TPR) repeat protein